MAGQRRSLSVEDGVFYVLESVRGANAANAGNIIPKHIRKLLIIMYDKAPLRMHGSRKHSEQRVLSNILCSRT